MKVSSDGVLYAATNTGLSVSRDQGATFITYTTTQGLADNLVNGVWVDGNKIYVSTWDSGIAVSTDSGEHWTTYTTAQGLPNNQVLEVYATADGAHVYAATSYGVTYSHF